MAPVVTPVAPVQAPAPDPPRRRRRTGPLVIGLAVVLLLVAVSVTMLRTIPPGPPPSNVGIAENRPVPADVLRIPLIDAQGRTTSLVAFHGKIVVLSSFLTSCQETCPLTTGAFLDMQRDLAAAGMAKQVVFIEASVDPGRDTPARLAAYARVTGATWPLLTGTPANLKRLWASFGIYSQKVAEGTPPGIDWLTGKPYTYDVDHSDGFIVFDQKLHERFVTGAAPNLRGQELQKKLEAMLDGQGRRNLNDPGRSSWTIPQGLEAIGWVAGRSIPQVN